MNDFVMKEDCKQMCHSAVQVGQQRQLGHGTVKFFQHERTHRKHQSSLVPVCCISVFQGLNKATSDLHCISFKTLIQISMQEASPPF